MRLETEQTSIRKWNQTRERHMALPPCIRISMDSSIYDGSVLIGRGADLIQRDRSPCMLKISKGIYYPRDWERITLVHFLDLDDSPVVIGPISKALGASLFKCGDYGSRIDTMFLEYLYSERVRCIAGDVDYESLGEMIRLHLCGDVNRANDRRECMVMERAVVAAHEVGKISTATYAVSLLYLEDYLIGGHPHGVVL